MHRIDSANSVDGEFSNGAPPLTPGTAMDAAWFNAVQEELINVIETLATTPLVKGTNTQLGAALYALFGRLAAANTWTQTNTFAGLLCAGLDVSGSATVGLGGINTGGTVTAAALEVGLTGANVAGPVSAGSFSTTGDLTVGGAGSFSEPISAPNVLRARGTISVSSGTVTVVSQHNVASASVSGNDIVITFTNALADADYSVTVNQPISSGATANSGAGSHSRTTGGLKLLAFDTSNAVMNPSSAVFSLMFQVA